MPEVITTNRAIAARWTEALVENGWTPVSEYFLNNYARLDPPISNGEAMFIIHLVAHKWDKGSPRPSMKTIARRMGLSEVSVRSMARSLEVKGYLTRIKRVGKPNYFRLGSLFGKLEEHRKAQPPPPPSDDEVEALAVEFRDLPD